MVHHPKAQFRQFIVGAGPLPEPARLHIALALPCPEKNIPSPAPFNAAQGDIVVLILVAVLLQLGAVIVKLKMRPHLIAAVLQVGIVGQVISATDVLDGADALDLGLDAVYDPHLIDVPDDGGLPVNAVQDALERLIGGDLIAAFFSADPHHRVGKKPVIARHRKFYDVRMLWLHGYTSHSWSFCFSEKPVFSW